MSERLAQSPEQSHAEQNIVRPERTHTEHDPAKQAEQVSHAREAVAAHAHTTERTHLPHVPVTERPNYVDGSTKRLRMRQNLKHVQSRLKPSEKRFSQLVHQPLVQAVSESAGKTVARPSGLFGAGLLAFVGSSGYLWLAHHYDLTYNYTFFLLFFLGGFVLGLAGEYGLFLAAKLRR